MHFRNAFYIYPIIHTFVILMGRVYFFNKVASRLLRLRIFSEVIVEITHSSAISDFAKPVKKDLLNGIS